MSHERALELHEIVSGAMSFLIPSPLSSLPLTPEVQATYLQLKQLLPMIDNLIQWYSNTIPIKGLMRETILTTLELQSVEVEKYFEDNDRVLEAASQAPGYGPRSDAGIPTPSLG